MELHTQNQNDFPVRLRLADYKSSTSKLSIPNTSERVASIEHMSMSDKLPHIKQGNYIEIEHTDQKMNNEIINIKSEENGLTGTAYIKTDLMPINRRNNYFRWLNSNS